MLAEDFLMAAKKSSLSNRLTGQGVITCYISYSDSDGGTYTTQLSRHLQKYGVCPLIPKDEISLGSRLVNVVEDLIKRADVLILVGTPGAFASRWVLEEAQYFYSLGRRILPIAFRDTVSWDTIPFFLRDIMWLQEDGSAISTGPSELALSRLVAALNRVRLEAPPTLSKPRRARSRARKRPLNEGKLILVGRGEVGKTSLIKRLVENEFNEDESKTQGIRITNWFLMHRANTFRLNVWDFGGQEIMHATHQFFLT
jgi:hypothetical protein